MGEFRLVSEYEATGDQPQAVEKIVEKRVEVPVAKLLNLPKEINGKPVPEFSPEDPSRPFRPGLAIPSDLKVSTEPRKIRL